MSEAGTWHVTGRAVATNGPELDRLFAPLADDRVRVVASLDVRRGPRGHRGRRRGRPAPHRLDLCAGRPRAHAAAELGTPASGHQGAAHPVVRPTGELPESLMVDGGPGTGRPQLVATTGPRAGKMRPVRTRQLRVTAAGSDGVGISELHVTGIADLRYQPDLGGPTGAACGFGPTIEVAGRVLPTRLRGTLRDVRRGAELTVVPCGDRTVFLPVGSHRIRVTNPAGFAMTSLSLVPPTATAAASSSRPRVVAWSATERRVEVSADSESVLAVGESYNRGWTASASGGRAQVRRGGRVAPRLRAPGRYDRGRGPGVRAPDRIPRCDGRRPDHRCVCSSYWRCSCCWCRSDAVGAWNRVPGPVRRRGREGTSARRGPRSW